MQHPHSASPVRSKEQAVPGQPASGAPGALPACLGKKLVALSRDDWLVMVRSNMCIPLVWARMRCAGLPATVQWASSSGNDRHQLLHAHSGMATHLGRLVNIASKYGPTRATCLTRSLVLLRELRRSGLTGELRIGVRSVVGGRLDAHAWVECDGVPINDRLDIAADFVAFAPLTSSIIGSLN